MAYLNNQTRMDTSSLHKHQQWILIALMIKARNYGFLPSCLYEANNEKKVKLLISGEKNLNLILYSYTIIFPTLTYC